MPSMHRASHPARAIGRRLALALPLALPAASLHAQPRGEIRPTRMIVPTPAGTSPDILARLVADGLSRRRGHPIAVENRTGAEGQIAAEAFVAAPRGEALFFSFGSLLTVVPLLYPRVPFDPDADFVAVGRAATDVQAFSVPAGAPIRSLAEWVAQARQQPAGSVTYFAAPGSPYLALRAFLHAHGIEATAVSYRGSPPALLDLAAGRISLVFSPVAPALPMAREGRVRVIATSGRERVPVLPDVPTSTEQGQPALLLDGPVGLFGWRGMPAAVAAELAVQMTELLADPAGVERVQALGMIPGATGPGAFAAELAEHRRRWAELVPAFGGPPA
jgi:tripartite-type tricarboxylate transporter receptor subunit TctC